MEGPWWKLVVEALASPVALMRLAPLWKLVDTPRRLEVGGMLHRTTSRCMEVGSKDIVEANLDVEVNYAQSHLTATRDNLVSVQMVMCQ